MINEENGKENNYEIISDLNDLFKRTYEFDIFKYVSRGLIKSQQNYENKLDKLKLDNLNTKKELLILKEEIENLKGEKNQQISDYKNYENNINDEIKKLTDEIKNKKREMLFINNLEKNNDIYGGYNNINLKAEDYTNNNKKRNKTKKINKSKEDNINSYSIEENKLLDEKKEENSQESKIKLTNTYINEVINEDKNKSNNNKNRQNITKEDTQYLSKFNELNNEIKNIKGKMQEKEKELNLFKIKLNQALSESSNNIQNNFSSKLLKLKEDIKTDFNSSIDDLNKNIMSLNDSNNTLKEKNEENEKMINKINSLNNSFLGKLEITKSKFIDYVSKQDFEKYKDLLYNKFDVENKEMSIDISVLKKTVNTIKSDLLNIATDTTDHENINLLMQKQESMNFNIEKLLDFQRELKEKDRKKQFLDTSKFIDVDFFNENQKNQMKIIDKIKRENKDLGRELTEIKTVDLINKASFKDLKNLEDDILTKMERLINNIKDKFVEKKYLNKYYKVIEYKTKQSLEEFKFNLKPGKYWLMAKKPVGHLCASCEAYLGDINETPTEKYFPKNKFQSKASGDDKNIKIGVGFSKMIQMANDMEKERFNSSEGNNSTTVNNGRRMSLNNIKENEDINNINNMSNNTSRLNKFNLENNNSYQFEEFETEIFNGSLPQIKKKYLNKNFSDEKLHKKHSIKSLKDLKKLNQKEEKADYLIMINSEIKRKNEIELGPKITKILKKFNKNNDSQINDESKKLNE